jgi:hypothetical protein
MLRSGATVGRGTGGDDEKAVVEPRDAVLFGIDAVDVRDEWMLCVILAVEIDNQGRGGAI